MSRDERETGKGPQSWQQSILPAFKKYMPQEPRDYRQWTDGRGNKIDSPPRQGRSSGGKLVPPLTTASGEEIRMGSLQAVRGARGEIRVVDWSLPAFPEEGCTIMGKCVFETREGLDRALAAMVVLVRDKAAEAARLPLEPAVCADKTGREIKLGALALSRFARGAEKGRFAVVDSSFSPRRIYDLKERDIKSALKAFEKMARGRRTVATPARKPHAGLMNFSPPVGFGGGGGFAREERTYPEPSSLSTKSIIAIYAKTGKWCRTASLIWADQRPAWIEERVEEARQEFLREQAKREEEKIEVTVRGALSKQDLLFLNGVLEHFELPSLAKKGEPK